MAEGARGWMGSVVVHLAVLAAFLAVSWWGARPGDAIEAVDPLVVTLEGVPGRKPGEVGRKEGVAKGSEKGKPFFKFTPLPPEKPAAQPAANRASTASSASSRARGSTTAATSKRVSLYEFNRGRGQGTASGVSSGITGVSLGRATGTGDNGGEGGLASARQLYAGEVLARFRDAWAEVVAAEGEDLGGLLCGVRVSISASGQVSFSAWIRQPSGAKAADLVRKAVGRIGNCGPPPENKAFTIDFTRVTAEGV